MYSIIAICQRHAMSRSPLKLGEKTVLNIHFRIENSLLSSTILTCPANIINAQVCMYECFCAKTAEQI